MKETAQVVGAPKKLSQPNRKLRPDELERLVVDYAAGTDIAALARSYGMHRQTVRNQLPRRGIILRSDAPALSQAQIDHVVQLYAAGLSTVKLGAQFGVSANTVTSALKARGAKLGNNTGP